MFFCKKQKQILLALSLVLFNCLDLCFGSELCASHAHYDSHGHHHHDCDHGHHHHCHIHNIHEHGSQRIESRLPEELAEEEEDMKLHGFSNYLHHHHDHSHSHSHSHSHDHVMSLTGLGLWLHALGCSLLVSLASLICLIILPVIFIQGKPSKAVVDSLALFGAGAMLGDAFLHQLPHAFGGEHSHSHDHDTDRSHHDHPEHGHSHAHSLKDLSVGLSILGNLSKGDHRFHWPAISGVQLVEYVKRLGYNTLNSYCGILVVAAGIVLFLLVEKVVRYVEANSSGAHAWSHGHHHHHHKSSKKMKDDDDVNDMMQSPSPNQTKEKVSDEVLDNFLNRDISTENQSLLRKRKTTLDGKDDTSEIDTTDYSSNANKTLNEKEIAQASSNLVFGYLNLFSDGVHNFTDGMALGSAFLLHGSVGGWSRTLFLLAHELPQEIGDFGILVRSGFSAPKALFFNFLSALVALAGTALALLWGQDPGQSSLIEGFTAGGFIYIAVAGVLAEMNTSSSTIKSSAVQVISLILGMAVALCISLVE